MLMRVRGGCVVHRCQNKNPRTRGWEWRHARKIWGDLKKVSWELDTKQEASTFRARRGQTSLRAMDTAWDGGRWKSQNRKNVYLSPYVEEPLNSKVIKSFVPELRSRKCFSCFGIPTFYVYMLWTFYVHFTYPYIWLWYNKFLN